MVADTVIANLVARGSLSLVGGRVERRSLLGDPHPLEVAAYSEVGHEGSMALIDLQRFTSASTRDLGARLRGLGLTRTPSVSAPFLLVAAVPTLLFVTALIRHQAFIWPLIGCLVALIFGTIRYVNAAGASPLGKAALESFRQSHKPLNDTCRRSQLVSGGDLPAVVALSGFEALRHLELGDIADALALARAQAAGSSTCGCGCGCG